MELIHVFLIFSVDFLSVRLATGKPDPPKDVRINNIGKNVNISWNISKDKWKTTIISLYDSKGGQVPFDSSNYYKYVPFPNTSYKIVNLTLCTEYVVKIEYQNTAEQWSDSTKQKFWMTEELQPPQNVRINIIGNIAHISWTITTIQNVNTSLISLFDSKGGKVSIDSSNNYKYLEFPVTSCVIVNLTLCSEYAVKIEYQSRGLWSGVTEQKFWMTNNTFTADINDNVALLWTTSLTEFFSVYSPFSSPVIYTVQTDFVENTESGKYIFDKRTTNLRAINITVIGVNKADAGLYRAVETRKDNADGCCFLIVTGKPINTTLTFKPEHPFVGDNITLMCSSTIQRWPAGYRSSRLSYEFKGNLRGATVNNMLTIHTLTKSDKGTNIKCQATDDLGKVSNMSNTVTLDPYYGPENVVVEPAIAIMNVTEGSALGPIYCIATCYPGCKYVWKQNLEGTFKPVPNKFISTNNRSVHILAVKRNQTGTYRCRVDHSTVYVKKTKDISVNVQYSPKITDIWFSSKNQRYGVRTPTTFDFNEEVNVKMTLRMESNPDPQIMFKSSLLKIQLINKDNGYMDYVSNLPSLKCEDSGNFLILANNGIPDADTRMVNLKICCKPRNATTKSRTIGAKIETIENIVFHVISFPAPTVLWDSKTGFDLTISKETYDYKHKISSKIRIESEVDFGVYGIKICNRVGCIVENITLKPQDKPEAPQNFSDGTTTFRSVNLSWIAGFNGGDTQHFTVQFKTTDDDKWETRTVHTNDTRTGSTIYYTLDQLRPDTSYQVMVFSTNKHGKRNASLEFKTKVEPTLSSPSSTASVSPLSIGIGCGCAVLVLLIILLVFISRRKKNSKTESKECNVLYAEVDKEQQKSKWRKPVKEDSDEPANAEYASVVKSKSKKVHYKEDAIETENNEYAVVDKSNKDYTENESVYANQEDGELLIHKPLEAQSSGRSTNQDGLTYIEVSFTSNLSDRRPIIGAESKTDYVDIDFTRKADPLPDDSD